MDNQQDQEIARLEEQLREVIAAENFFETGSGKLFQQLASAKINYHLNEITSGKFRKDLVGYNNALSDMNAYKQMLKAMQVAASPLRKQKILERLDEDES